MIPSMIHSRISIAVVFWLMYLMGDSVLFSLNCKKEQADPWLQ